MLNKTAFKNRMFIHHHILPATAGGRFSFFSSRNFFFIGIQAFPFREGFLTKKETKPKNVVMSS